MYTCTFANQITFTRSYRNTPRESLHALVASQSLSCVHVNGPSTFIETTYGGGCKKNCTQKHMHAHTNTHPHTHKHCHLPAAQTKPKKKKTPVELVVSTRGMDG